MQAKQSYHQKQQALTAKYVLGVDPGKEKHSGVVLDPSGLPLGSAFTFPVSREGYDEVLWDALRRRLRKGHLRRDRLVVAIETSCNLWVTLAHYFREAGYTVVLVSPLTTRHSRPLSDHDFSKSDPKDAFLVADNAQKGRYDAFRVFDPEMEAAHELSIAYDKVLKQRSRHIQRLRSLMEKVFPEYLGAFAIQTQTSLYLLERYFLPEDFLSLDVDAEGEVIRGISRGKHGPDTLRRIQAWAKATIGVPTAGQEEALRLVLDGWVQGLRTAMAQLKALEKAMIARTRAHPTFEILDSITNIDKNLAAQFVAETRGPDRFTHYKQLEKFAGTNVRLCDSGKSQGNRRIGRIGNRRLRRILYQMTQQTIKVVPMVRRRYLERELKEKCYKKNVIAASSQLLQLIVALVRDGRCYEERPEQQRRLRTLERRYSARYKRRRRRPTRAAA